MFKEDTEGLKQAITLYMNEFFCLIRGLNGKYVLCTHLHVPPIHCISCTHCNNRFSYLKTSISIHSPDHGLFNGLMNGDLSGPRRSDVLRVSCDVACFFEFETFRLTRVFRLPLGAWCLALWRLALHARHMGLGSWCLASGA